MSPTSAPTGTPVSFNSAGSTDPNGRLTSYSWDFGDGSTSTLATPSHSYASAGTYRVTLTVTDEVGETSAPVVQTIAVTDRPPTAAFTPTAATVLAGSNVAFNGTPSNDPDGSVSGYSWNFGDGSTSTSAQPGHTYMNVGTFTVSLTVTDNSGNKATVSHLITVIAPPPLQTLIETPLAGPALVKGAPPSITRFGLVKLGQRAFCPGPGVACSVTITATTSAAVGRTARLPTSARTIRVGRSHITVASKQSAALTFRLSKPARSYLRKHGRLPLRVTIVVQRGTLSAKRVQSFTLH
jgi:chitodextrinase